MPERSDTSEYIKEWYKGSVSLWYILSGKNWKAQETSEWYCLKVRKECENEKVSWSDYVSIFKTRNPDIPESFYGKWADPPPKPEMRKPKEKDYCIPTNQSELDDLMNNMRKSGFNKEGVIQILKERKIKFDAAMDEYEKARKETNLNSKCH